jgi:Cu/Ag efflux pump CusA
VISGGKEPIVVRVFGQNLTVLREKAAEIEEIMGSIEGVQDQHTDVSTDVPQLQVEVDLAKAEKYGLKPGDVRRAAATLVAGEEVGDIFRGGKAYDVVVWSTPQTRTSVPDIRSLRIDTPSGGTVRLADVADVSLQPSPNAIDREGDSRRLDVSATFEGDLGSVVEELENRLEGVNFEQGYHAEVLGEWTERQSAQRTLLATAVIAGAAILLLLQASFSSWRLALLSFLTLPMALVGGVMAAFLGGGVVSLGSLIGFFTVFGIAARNGILLINHFQHLEREEGMSFGRDLVVRGARERLSPILMTSLATGLALVPLVMFGERPGQEIEHPLAIVILGGLVTSTLLNLFVMPSLYLRFGKPLGETTPGVAEPKAATG